MEGTKGPVVVKENVERTYAVLISSEIGRRSAYGLRRFRSMRSCAAFLHSLSW